MGGSRRFVPRSLAERRQREHDVGDGATTHLGTHFGPLQVRTRDGAVVEVVGHDLDPAPASFAETLVDHTTLRVGRPVVRRSWLEGGPGTRPEARGSEPFVEVEWDHALDLVAGELTRVRDRFGHTSVFGGSYGWGSAGRFHYPGTQVHRFLRMFGGYTDVRGTYSASAAETVVPYIIGMGYHQGIAEQTSWSVIAEHTELMVSFGGMRSSNTQVTFGGQGPHHTGEWMRRAAERGTRFLNISPLRDDIDPALSPRWMPIRPGTDVALMLGLIHTLVADGLADEGFLATHCTGWEVLAAYLEGSDGVVRSAEWAADICGIETSTVIDLAHELASCRTLLNLSLSLQRAHHGEQSYWAIFALAAALGQIGLPGGGVAYPFGAQGNVGSGQRRARVPGVPLPRRPDDSCVISVSRITELLEGAGQRFDFDGAGGTFPDIRMIYWAGGNPFHHHQDLNRLSRAWQGVDTVVVHEPFWTPVARRADIVFPSTTPLERDDLAGQETMLVAAVRAVDPPPGARDDYWILGELAGRLGFGDTFTEGRSADEWVATLYDIYRAEHHNAPTYDAVRETGYLLHEGMAAMGANRQVFLEQFRADPQGSPLPTPSGRIELFSETVANYGYDDCPGHPAWIEPFERLGGAKADQFPLHLVSNQPASRLHSQYDHGRVSQASKVAGREPVRIHPRAAAQRGIADGDVVRLFNERGACLAGAVIDDGLMPEVVQLSTGAWYDPDETGMCRAGNPNVLTADVGTSRLAQGPSAHTCLVDVERFEGEAPRVEAYDPPEVLPLLSRGD